METNPSAKINEEWLKLISLNDPQAFDKVFEHFYVGLCLYAKRFIKDIDTREDLVQDVFCSIWVNRKNIDYNLSVANYLITAVKNRCLNYLRSNWQEKYDYEMSVENIPVYAENNEDLILLNELEEMLQKAIEKLPPEYRIAFEMSRMENKSSAEIAEVMGVSVRTVERYRNKAIDILKNELRDYLPLLMLLLGTKNMY